MARILLAEDEDSLRELVARALNQDGHEVVANCDGAAALDALMRDVIAKPFTLTTICGAVRDALAVPQMH